MKKKYKCLNLDDYIFPGYEEITGDELYRINGGGRIQPEQNENPPEEGSSSSDNYTVQSGDTLSQIVYDYNQANGTHLTVDEVAALSGIENPDLILPGQSIVFSNPEQGGETGQPVDPTNPAESTSTSSNPSSTSSGNPSANSGTTVPDFADPFAPVSNGNFGVDDVNQIISADINNPQSVIDAYNSYHIHADRGYKFQIKDGDEVVHTFSDAKYARNYVETLDISKEDLIAEEKNVISYLKEIEQNPENYSIEAYERKALTDYPVKKFKLLTHSLYIITNEKTNETYTLSFNGTKKALYSEGAWGLNTATDIKSLNSFRNGDNSYSMMKIFNDYSIDPEKTAENIINSINSDTTYYAKDHVKDKPNMENCNTALYSTVFFDFMKDK